jgi:hypothetical protein
MQSLSEDPPLGLSPAEVAEEARARFTVQLNKQLQQKEARPRERALPVDEGRVGQALEAVIAEAQRIARIGVTVQVAVHGEHGGQGEHGEYTPIAASHDGEDLRGEGEADTQVLFVSPGGILVEVEQDVQSKDGMFKGRVDRAEFLPEGTRLVDYKSAVRDDLPERYARQLQMYAFMWNDSRGEWPVEADVVYSFIGTSHRVKIDPTTCREVAEEARHLVKRVLEEPSTERLGEPGDVCKVCEFRPWCKPFWSWQSGEKGTMQALSKSGVGFEGEITGIEEVSGHWRVVVGWRGHQIKIIAPTERFLQLARAQVGMRVRALDMPVKGQLFDLKASISPYSELFLVAP